MPPETPPQKSAAPRVGLIVALAVVVTGVIRTQCGSSSSDVERALEQARQRNQAASKSLLVPPPPPPPAP